MAKYGISENQVKPPYQDDYKKLERLVNFLKGIQDLVLTLEADDMHLIKRWVGGSFSVYNYIKGHTGTIMSMG